MFPSACFLSWIVICLAKIRNYSKYNHFTAALMGCFLLLCLQVSTLLHRVQESEALLSSLQQAFSEAQRSTQEHLVSSTHRTLDHYSVA